MEKPMEKKAGKNRFLMFFLLAIFAFSFSLLFFYINFPISGNFVKTGSGPYTYTCSNCSDCSAAIVDSAPGDTIYLNQPIYSVSFNCINITNKNNIIFDCQNNNIVNASSSASYGIILTVSDNNQVRNCNINGFSNSGVYLFYSNNNLLTNIDANYNGYGTYLYNSKGNSLANVNTIGNTFDGINLVSSSSNNFLMVINSNSNMIGVNISYMCSNNGLNEINATSNAIGIYAEYGGNFSLSDSHIIGNSQYGLYLSDSSTELIYNNIFNNTNNWGTSGGPRLTYFNASKFSGINIIGGNYIGGNFWATPTGTGFSQNCTTDVNGDKICDYPYNLSGSYDYLPLIYNTVNTTCTENWNCTGWSDCNASGIRTKNCTDINHCGTTVNKPALNTTCTYSCTESWTCTNWTACNISGIKTKNCTDSNWCGTNTTRPSLNSTCTYSANCTESWTCSSWSDCNASGIKTKTCTDTHSCGTYANKPALISTCTYSSNSSSTGATGSEGVGTNITHNVTTITPANPIVINISDSQIYLTKIILNVLESIQSASVTVTKVNVLSDSNLAVGLPSGQFYQGFRVDTSGVTDSNIANVTIEFKVNKLWLASKNGTASGIGLYRKADTSSQWNGLGTSLTSQDSTYYYFTSVSPGFSTFAVFFQPCEGIECATATSNLTVWLYIIIAVIGVAIIIVSYVLFRKVKENKVVRKTPVAKKPVKSPFYKSSR